MNGRSGVTTCASLQQGCSRSESPPVGCNREKQGESVLAGDARLLALTGVVCGAFRESTNALTSRNGGMYEGSGIE